MMEIIKNKEEVKSVMNIIQAFADVEASAVWCC